METNKRTITLSDEAIAILDKIESETGLTNSQIVNNTLLYVHKLIVENRVLEKIKQEKANIQ